MKFVLVTSPPTREVRRILSTCSFNLHQNLRVRIGQMTGF
jgi:hypothetical protein